MNKRVSIVLCFLLGCILCFAQDYAELFIYRDSSPLFAGNNHEVSVNGTYLTSIPNENYIVVKVPAGKITLASYSSYMRYDNNGNGTAVNTNIGLVLPKIEVGKKYYVQLKDFLTPSFSYVKKDKAIKKIEKKMEKEDLGLIGEFSLIISVSNLGDSDEGNNSKSNGGTPSDNPMLQMMNSK